MAQLNRLGHIDVHITLGEPGDVNREVRAHLEALGLHRRIAMTVPSFTTAAMVTASTDYVGWLPDHAAQLFVSTLPLRVVASPLPRLEIGCVLLWHERTHTDAGCAFFRDIIISNLREARRVDRRPAVASEDRAASREPSRSKPGGRVFPATRL
jgi:DNA-binding transcriptional LysR family regulator